MPGPSLKPEIPRLRYLQAYGSVFDGPHWGANLLWCTLCGLIPVVGQIVMSGYCYELIELNTKQPGTPNPPFTFERFTAHLTRGAWPFVIQLIIQLTLQPILTIVFEGGLFGIIFGSIALGPDLAPVVLVLGLSAWCFLGVAVGVGLGLVICPILLRAGMSQDFVKAFDLRWVFDFNRRVGLEAVLAILFMVCTVPVLIACGYAMCFVGLIPVSIIIVLAANNLWWQLYNLYLARGGTPIPLKPPPAPPMILPPSNEPPLLEPPATLAPLANA